MKIGLVGSSYQQRSLPFDAQRSVNLFPVVDQQGKEVASMYGTPGIESFSTCGTGAIRGGFSSSNGRCFFVSDSRLFEVFADGSSTVLGSLKQSSGYVSMAENNNQLAICDGSRLYIFTYSNSNFQLITNDALPACGTVCYLDGYFIVNSNNTGRFYISGLNDGTSWDALDFATAESSPDNLLACFSALGQLWLIGERTIEVWTNTGASTFPFKRIAGAIIQAGCLAVYSIVEVENSIIWVGQDKNGSSIVYSASGVTSAQRISTTPIEIRISSAQDKANMISYTYQEDGHTFYVLTGGDLETTLVYDLLTGEWHERAYTNEFGRFEQHLSNCHVFAFGKHLVGSRRDGKIYNMSLDIYSDNGNALVRERTYTFLSDEDKRLRYNKLNIGIESGVGLQSGQGSDPMISLELSKDGARTWSNSYSVPFGKVGEFRQNVSFRRLGISQTMCFRIRISDPVKVCITGSYLS